MGIHSEWTGAASPWHITARTRSCDEKVSHHVARASADFQVGVFACGAPGTVVLIHTPKIIQTGCSLISWRRMKSHTMHCL